MAQDGGAGKGRGTSRMEGQGREGEKPGGTLPRSFPFQHQTFLPFHPELMKSFEYIGPPGPCIYPFISVRYISARSL
jgi:hypothetical protein